MTGSDIQSIFLSDPRLAAHALSSEPVWLWSADASRILWANPTAAAIFGGATPGTLAEVRFGPQHPAAAEIVRLIDKLPEGGATQLEQLLGFGAPLANTLLCLCSRFTLTDGTAAVLVVSSERAGTELPFTERARRLLMDFEWPAAMFTASGELVEAKPGARQWLAIGRDLTTLGAEDVARAATVDGQAEGESAAGHIRMWRLGAGPTFLLLVAFTGPSPEAQPADAPTAPVAEPAPPETGAEPEASPPETTPVAEAPAPPERPTPPHEPISVPAPPTVPSTPVSETAEPPVSGTPEPEAVDLPPRRSPQRFVWQMDASNCFTHGLEDFARMLGPNTAAALSRPWGEIAAKLALDSDGAIAHALAEHNTWSGVVVQWPTDEGEERLPIEMSGLPVFDRDRQFAGYRGFGICRDMDKLAHLEARRAQAALTPPKLEEPEPPEPPQIEEPETEEPKVEEPKVVPFPAAPPPPPEPPPSQEPEPPPAAQAPEEPQLLPSTSAPSLSPRDHSAFQELARDLSERLKKAHDTAAQAAPPEEPPPPDEPVPMIAEPPRPAEPPRAARNGDAARDVSENRPILDRLPVGILVYRLNDLLYANRAFLEWTGYPDLTALTEAGGLDSLFIETEEDFTAKDVRNGKNGARPLTISTIAGSQRPVQGRLLSVAWNNENALVLMIDTQARPEAPPAAPANEFMMRRLEAENREIKSILDTATDGVLVLDRTGHVISANRSAQALFGYDAADFAELSLGALFVPESRRGVLDYLGRQSRGRGFEAGREAIGQVRQGGMVPLYITIGRIEDGEKLCAVVRDVTVWKRSEEDLISARQHAEKISAAKSEFLAKISHEIRTPLNAIIGFSEVMIDERFGTLGNERYKQYLKDIHASGSHLLSLLNDLLDLSKIETGKLDLTFVGVNLNELVQQCVAIMQPEANRERVIIRTSLPPKLPQVMADPRSVRQIMLNLLSNSIKFTGAGGQVIVSTALTDDDEVILRVRDTGSGMSERDLQTALEPFRQLATTARRRGNGTGLGLPITKALTEANHARFAISSRVDDGTLVEVTFPAMRVLAQ